MEKILEKLRQKENLTFKESKSSFELLMTGKASEDEIYNFLTLLSEKGEVSDEIAGGVYVLREKSKRVNVVDCVDTCGTGGDGMNTLNISTASALLLASMGTKVAKHGNKAVSSKCGSGDVLEALKSKIDLEPNDIEKEINNNNFGFMFAPNYHSAMRFVGSVRKKIGKRKILYRLKDWGISRQRYWGCPIPMIYLEDGSVVPVEKSELPIELPDDIDLNAQGNPLETHPTWKNTVQKSSGKKATRERAGSERERERFKREIQKRALELQEGWVSIESFLLLINKSFLS